MIARQCPLDTKKLRHQGTGHYPPVIKTRSLDVPAYLVCARFCPLRSIGRRVPDRFDPRLLLDVVDVAASDPLHSMLADASVPVSDRVALAIAAPAFQWR